MQNPVRLEEKGYAIELKRDTVIKSMNAAMSLDASAIEVRK